MSDNLVIGDWGTSRLRLWRLEDGAIAERREGPGIAATPDPPVALGTALGDWSPDRIILCGMAGARNGLHETPYAECPVSADDWANRAARRDFRGIPLVITAGAAWRDANGRPDVMRGEETQVFGAIALDPALGAGKHCLVLPGTHSKWVTLADGRITAFRTFITGELFEMLKRSSLFAVDGSPAEADLEAGYSDGLARRANHAELSSLLFEARSAQLVKGKSPGWASGFVSGILIGAEIAEMQPNSGVMLMAEPKLAARYSRALARCGLDSAILGGEECAMAGLRLLDADA